MSRLDVEWIALRAGLKPALRLSARHGEAAGMAARFRAAGLCVVEAPGWIQSLRRDGALLYVAPRRDVAEALRDAEAPTLRGEGVCPRDVSIQCASRVGELLGYPACCVAAFCARMARGVGRCGDGRTATELYVAALEAWRELPHPWLNNLRRPEHLGLVSFEPCAYDCAAALEWACRCRQALRAVDAPATEQLERALAVPVAVAASGARALVELRHGRVAHAGAPAREEPPSRQDVALARELGGADVDEAGRVAARAWSPVIVCDFSRVSR
jgi:hypothetical protein